MHGRAIVVALAAILTWPVASFAELIVNPARPITHRVSVQIIETALSDGTSPATIFGNASQRASIEAGIDAVWAQAGIDIAFLPSITRYNNTFAYEGNGGTRPTSDLGRIVSSANSAAVTNANPSVINMFFVNVAPGFAFTSENSANGIANIANDGIAQFVGDNLLTFQGGRDVIASVVAHEIGHNLGLDHTASGQANLMSPQGTSEQLTATQIAAALSRTGFPQLLPLQLTGDYNRNGVVDAADYAVWRNSLGTSTNLAADGNSDGAVNHSDYLIWRANYGNRAAPGTSAGVPLGPSVVPEPTTATFLGIVALVALGRWILRQKRAKERRASPEPACRRHPASCLFPLNSTYSGWKASPSLPRMRANSHLLRCLRY